MIGGRRQTEPRKPAGTRKRRPFCLATSLSPAFMNIFTFLPKQTAANDTALVLFITSGVAQRFSHKTA